MGFSIDNEGAAAATFGAATMKKEKSAAGSRDFLSMLTEATSAPAVAEPKKSEEKPTKAKIPEKSAAEEFLEYMHKPAAERMMEAWLRQKGISEAEWEAMPADKKAALMEEMRQEIEEKIRKAAEESKDSDQVKLPVGVALG